MKSRKFTLYCIFSTGLTLLLGAYPLYMGIKVAFDMIKNGTVNASDYPKYIIPYTPITLAILFACVLMPVFMKYFKKYASLAATFLSSAVFFAFELILENCVTVTGNVITKLEAWQMYMCYVSPEMYETRTWTPVDILIGDYNPSFKLHFYAISLILIIAFVGVIYGFARVVLYGEHKRTKPLTVLAVLTLCFLALCVFACFTAFYRTGELTVKPVSALLMTAFFIIMGLTAGIFVACIAKGRGRAMSVILPSIVSMLTTFLMYVAEMCLLSGHLYRFGNGFLFDGLGAVVLSPVDIGIIIASGLVCALVCIFLNKE